MSEQISEDSRDQSASNRGAPARIDPDGSVKGSGAGAGGGGSPEDFDSGSSNGAGGDIQPRTPRPPGAGGDAPSHGSS